MDDKEFKKLQQLWYDKLKKDGFVDIEDPKFPRRSESYITARYKRGTEEFFLRVYQFSENYTGFKTPRHKEIWQLYSEGIPYRIIASQLGCSVRTVIRVIKEYKLIMMSFR